MTGHDRAAYALLHRCMKEAIVDCYIKTNPCDGYRLPQNAEKQRTAHAPEFLSAAEIDQVLSSGIPFKYRLIYEIAIFTGLRASELWGLRWQDMELDGPRPRCKVTCSYSGPTKNTKARAFVLLPRARQALLRWRDHAKHRAPSDLVFPSSKGRMHTDGNDAGWSKHKWRSAPAGK